MDEADCLTALCMRSKAHWGYDAAFMHACREELRMTAVAAGSIAGRCLPRFIVRLNV